MNFEEYNRVVALVYAPVEAVLNQEATILAALNAARDNVIRIKHRMAVRAAEKASEA